jgi:hypothetical protein
MTFTEMEQAVEDARRIQLLCDSQATAMAKMLVGRLRKVANDSYSGGEALCELKRELQKFNMQFRTWKD